MACKYENIVFLCMDFLFEISLMFKNKIEKKKTKITNFLLKTQFFDLKMSD